MMQKCVSYHSTGRCLVFPVWAARREGGGVCSLGGVWFTVSSTRGVDSGRSDIMVSQPRLNAVRHPFALSRTLKELTE